ncbi:hypothetical protein [Pseudomonas sp. Pseu.R1]|uniref:hypothetical protein n=1 Tax=Pseudomonas sp. Pseu.R1 TaxID=3379818 RepID=UPI003B956AF2
MRISSARKIVVIQAHPHLSSTCAQLMHASMAQLKGADGCVDCHVHVQGQSWGRWVIECAWSTLETMDASTDAIFRPAFEQLIERNLLRSIAIYERDDATEHDLLSCLS